MYLNAEVYTGIPRYTDCISVCKQIIASGYQLADNYAELFMADNGQNPLANCEIIFPVCFDGNTTQSYGMAAVILGSRSSSEFAEVPAGIGGGWDGFRGTPRLVRSFQYQDNESPKADEILDKRGIFFDKNRSVEITTSVTGTFTTEGWAVYKYTNLQSNGEPGKNTTFPDTDFPMVRLGDVYLMYAEALYFDGNEGTAREYLDKVLMRAVKNDQTLFDELKTVYRRDDFVQELIESRMRELPFEFSRKWDLIRFNMIDEAIAALDNTRLTRFDGQEIKVRLFKRDWSGKAICDPETGEIIFEEGVMPEELRENLLKFPDNGGVGIGVQTLQHNWAPHKIWLPISEEQIGVNPKLYQNADWGGNTGAGIIPDEETGNQDENPSETPDVE
jgi:hypothetical protein